MTAIAQPGDSTPSSAAAVVVAAADTVQTSVAALTPLLAFACFVNMVGTLALSPFLPLIADELGTSVSVVGQISSTTMLLAAVLGLVAGPLGDRYGYRRSLVLGLTTATISALGLALAPALVPLFAAGLFGAVGRSIVMPTAMATITTLVPDETTRRSAISWIATGTTASPLIGIPLLTTLAAFTNWRVSLGLLGIVAGIMALVLWKLLPRSPQAAQGPFRLRQLLRAYGPLLHHRPSVALIAASLTTSIGVWGTFTYTAAFFVQIHGLDTAQVGLTYLVIGVGTVLGTRIVGSRLGAHPRLLLIAGRFVGGLAVLGALALPVSVYVALGLLTVAALTSTMSMSSSNVMLASDVPGGKGTALTLHAAALSLGTALGAAAGGLVLALADYAAIGLMGLLFFWLSAILVWLFHHRASAARSA